MQVQVDPTSSGITTANQAAGTPGSQRSTPVSKARRRLWSTLWHWRTRLIDGRRYGRLVLEEVASYPILVLPQVFNPKLLRTGEALAKTLNERLIPGGCRVLDMGTGSGIGAIVAARWAGRVVAIDINPEAVRAARINMLLNRVEDRVEVRQGDLFAPVSSERFDVVLFNPPFYRGEPSHPLDQAWRSTDLIERFAAGLPEHLSIDGRAIIILSTHGEHEAFLGAFEASGLERRVLAERDLINEVLTVYELRLKRQVAC